MGQYRQLEREKNTQVLQLNQRLEESHQAREKLAEAMAMQVRRARTASRQLRLLHPCDNPHPHP